MWRPLGTLKPLTQALAGTQDLMLTAAALAMCLGSPRWRPLLYTMLTHIFFCLPLSSCGEDMEASDGEGEEEVLPPSKVIR